MIPVKQILAAADAAGSAFAVAEGTVFILMADHAGGDWKLQIERPDTGAWMDIADSSGGVTFDSDGLQVFVAQSFLNYRLFGGTTGAVAWLLSTARNPGLKG